MKVAATTVYSDIAIFGPQKVTEKYSGNDYDVALLSPLAFMRARQRSARQLRSPRITKSRYS